MNAEILAVLVTAALGLLTIVRAPDRQLSRLDTETQILARLEPASAAAAAVREVVNVHAMHLRDDLPLARDWQGAVFFAGVYFVLALAGLVMVDRGDLWVQIAGVPVLLAAGGCLFLAHRQGQRVPRDRDGSRREA